MRIAEMVKANRESAGISKNEFAKRLGISLELIEYIENPEIDNPGAVELFASALGMSPAQFKGEKPEEPPPKEERRAPAVKNARFPSVRAFILDPSRCLNPEVAIKIFGDDPFPLAERNVLLYLSTTALYHFCDTNVSSFAFDEYLFALHGKLLARFEQELQREGLSGSDAEERLNSARSNIFCCDRIENIAIMVFESFTAELEGKLTGNTIDFEEDLHMPFTWEIDDSLMKIVFKDDKGNVRDQIKLLDVKGRR